MLSTKQGNFWYHFYIVFCLTLCLTGDWNQDLLIRNQPSTTRLSRCLLSYIYKLNCSSSEKSDDEIVSEVAQDIQRHLPETVEELAEGDVRTSTSNLFQIRIKHVLTHEIPDFRDKDKRRRKTTDNLHLNLLMVNVGLEWISASVSRDRKEVVFAEVNGFLSRLKLIKLENSSNRESFHVI